jgi:predicted MPP superfamily phosphohydrolase
MQLHTRRLTLHYPSLPAALEGFKIAQVSDIHVGWCVPAEALASVVEAVEKEKPDVFTITGDIIDDISQLDRTMEMLSAVKAKHGSFACIGNHEYYAGMRPIRKAYSASPIALLEDDATTVKVGDAALEISGVSYPLGRMGKMTASDRFPMLAERALVERGKGGDFRLHLAHHPHAFDAAAERGANLVLAGHTHGGQVGVGSRSLFSPFYRYCRGLYGNNSKGNNNEGNNSKGNNSKLFVHSGTGHWWPVRVGCPAEVAIITLSATPT